PIRQHRSQYRNFRYPSSDIEQLVAFRCELRVGEFPQQAPWIDAAVLAIGERQVQSIGANEFDPLDC
ncbi:MAG: hypothetical protein MKZ95_08940, partial [Pirellulales bacterium]|nr:hypothetical protein [Pirellulales bacterium]